MPSLEARNVELWARKKQLTLKQLKLAVIVGLFGFCFAFFALSNNFDVHVNRAALVHRAGLSPPVAPSVRVMYPKPNSSMLHSALQFTPLRRGVPQACELEDLQSWPMSDFDSDADVESFGDWTGSARLECLVTSADRV